MRPYLTFALRGVMGSFGGPAPNERRGTWLRPSRSATVGLIAACLGIDRSEGGRLVALSEGVGVATALLGEPGIGLDYHTVQDPDPVEVRRWSKAVGRGPATRAEAMSCGAPETIVTRREYLTNVDAVVAVWSRTGDDRLEGIAEAMERPRHVPYLGRRAFPLTAPLAPQVAVAGDAAAAIVGRSRRGRVPGEVATDADDPCATLPGRRAEIRRDASRHEAAWTFDERLEWVVPLGDVRRATEAI